MDIGNFTDSPNHGENHIILNTSNKGQENVQGILELHFALPKDLRNRIESKMDEFDISFEKRQKLILYINSLARSDIKTAEHSIRVALLSENIANVIKIDSKAMFYSGLLHDLGKILVPCGILQKSEGFESIDMDCIRNHPLNTFKILGKDFAFSAEVGLRHHRYQKNGYPEKLPDSIIPFSEETKNKIEYYSRVLAVADFFDAAVTRKNNKFGKSDAMKIDETVCKMLDQCEGQKEIIEQILKSGVFEKHLEMINKN